MRRVAQEPTGFRHVVEVHAIHRADNGGSEEYGGVCGDPFELFILSMACLGQCLHLRVLLLVDQGGVDGEDFLQCLTETVHPLGDLGGMVGNVAQVTAQLFVNAVLLETSRKRIERCDQRAGGTLKLDDLTG